MSGREQINEAFERPIDIYPADCGPPDPAPDDPGIGHNGPPDDPDLDPEIELAKECATLPANDYGNGKRFSKYFGENLAFVPRVGWFCWDRRAWVQDDDDLEVRRLSQQVGGMITKEAEHINLEDWEIAEIELADGAHDAAREIIKIPSAKRTESQAERLAELKDLAGRADDLNTKLRKMRAGHHSHAKGAGNSGPINNMMGEAKVDLYVTLKRFNADPLMINTENCVIRFDTALNAVGVPTAFMETLPHDRDLYLSKMMPVEHDPAATCPTFLQFLETVQPSVEMREFLQRWFGYSLTGLTTEQKLVFFYGGGRNGKSTLVDLVADMMGPYATTVPIESLTGSDTRKGADATPDLVRLPGARMVRASEPEQGTKMKEAQIKALTGGEAILVRRMMQEFVEVNPEFKLTISGNHRPEIRGGDDGIWRRMLLVPWDVQIPQDQVDKMLGKKLWAERSGVLNWMLEGLRKWIDSGLMIPDEITDATTEYRDENDHPLAFLKSCCEVTGLKDDFLRARDMNDNFNFWMRNKGEREWGARTVSNHFIYKAKFYKSEAGRTFAHDKSNNTGYRGIKLKQEFIDLRAEADQDARGFGAPPPEPDVF